MNLRKTQSEFARALRQADRLPVTDGAADFAERFDTYRNNTWQFFATALEQTYPVVQRRVGPEFFRQLAREYRAVHPSRRGDLHWVGADFPAWLAVRMAGSAYEWLADLAQVEWTVADASLAAAAPAAGIETLTIFAPEVLADLRVSLHPSVRLVASRYPVWSVWQANQLEDAAPVDLAQGGEHCVVACVGDSPVTYRIDPVDYRLFEQLAAGDTFGGAIEATGADAEVLARVLGWAFAEQLVTGVVSPSAPA